MYESRRRELSTRFRQVLREVEAHTPVNSLLDVGCSTGFYLDLARDLGVGSVEGVELDEGCRSWGRENLGLEIARSIGDVKGREFDVVLMLDVLEHVADPLQILREVLHLLKPGGFAFCQSPNIDSEMARRSGSRWSWLIPPDHVIHFTPMSLERLLEAAGFTVEESYTGDFVADYVGDVYPLIPGRLLIRLASIDRFAILRRRAGSQGGIIRLIARRTA